MLKNVNWSNNRVYRTHGKHEPVEFYLKALANSASFDLLLGYFSTSAINVLSLGFATFIHRGGTVRIVANHILSKQDKEAILAAESGDFDSLLIDLTDIKSLVSNLDEYGTHFFNCISYLIANKRIELVLVSPKEGRGISHYKSGTFHDGTDTVGFTASCNFTYSGLVSNLEKLEAFLLWENSRSSKLIDSEAEYFEELFIGKADFVDYIDPVDIEIAIQDGFQGKTIDELLVDEQSLLKAKSSVNDNSNLAKVISEQEILIEKLHNSPKFPYPSGPRDYQVEAYQNWAKNDKKGLFAMATGTGKTITSLNCVLEEYRLTRVYRFIVLVPTISLASQWENEIVNKFNFKEITVCSSKNKGWENEISRYRRNLSLGMDFNFCIVTTYASFRSDRFQTSISHLISIDSENLILIADEAHTMGSKSLLKVLPHSIYKRIGLSATPERQYDDQGQLELCSYFDSYGPYYTFSFNMKEAIDKEVLCKYYYYPKLVDLENDEFEEYLKITKKLLKFIDSETGKYKDDPYVNSLLIKRKNVIHKARRKSTCLLDIVDQIEPENFQHAFIYVPEGYEANYDEIDIEPFHQIDDEKLISQFTTLLYDKYKFRLRKFTGGTADRDEILEQFTNGKLDALLAMKCLDEGVDVPQTKYAIFCSSTGNPRQYIQRRGRVLRKHKDKEYAYIYDMIVKPRSEPGTITSSQANVEKNIFLTEMRRLVNFAVLAENKIDCLGSIERISYDLNIDIYDLANLEESKYKQTKD